MCRRSINYYQKDRILSQFQVETNIAKPKTIQFYMVIKSRRYEGMWSLITYYADFTGRYLAFPRKIANYLIKEVWGWSIKDQPSLVVYWTQDGYECVYENMHEHQDIVDEMQKFVDELNGET